MRIQGFGFVRLPFNDLAGNTSRGFTCRSSHLQWDQRLLTFDRKAIQYILVQATEVYPKAWQSRQFLTRLLGEGVAITEGEQHKRQRKVINPAFSPAALRQLSPIFNSKAAEVQCSHSTARVPCRLT